MRTKAELLERMKHYQGARFIYEEYGYIVWQMSTGENIEILFIDVKEPRKGYGTKLIKQMKHLIKPYHSVFVFRRANNGSAGEFYRKLGFEEQVVKNLYKGEDAVLGVIPFEKL